jgi:tetrahydromethanopterin S-methyltransferase subunit F
MGTSIFFTAKDLKARIIAAVKKYQCTHFDACVAELKYRVDVFRVTRGAHIENLHL